MSIPDKSITEVGTEVDTDFEDYFKGVNDDDDIDDDGAETPTEPTKSNVKTTEAKPASEEPEEMPDEQIAEKEVDEKPAEQQEQTEEEIELVYDKQPQKKKKSEVIKLAQKGMNYDRIHGRLSETEQKLKQIQDTYGMSVDQLITYGNQRKVTEYAETHGVSEDVAKEIISQRQELETLKQRESIRERDSLITKQKFELKDKKYFKELEPEIDEYLTTNMNITDVATVYNYLIGERLDDLIKKEVQQSQKSTIANIQDKNNRSVEKGKTKGNEPQAKISDNVRKAAEAMGIKI